jgi:DNA-binding IclR family transcriptional regulator
MNNSPVSGDANSQDLDRSLVKSLGKALAIIESIAAVDHPLTISEIAMLTRVPRPTAHRLVQTLISADYLRSDPIDGRVSIGFAPITIAARAMDNDRVRMEALPHLQTLAQETGERSNLGCLFRHQVLYLAGVEKPSLPSVRTRFGRIVSAHACSVGKAIAAFLPEADVLELVNARPLVRITSATITELTAFMDELAQIRRQGYSVDRGECNEGSYCIAAPIFLSSSRPVAAIGLTGRDLNSLLAASHSVQRAAELISHRL